jgi:hypothetical protein
MRNPIHNAVDYLKRALHEYNMAIPASSPFYTRLEQLPASMQSRIKERAAELEEQELSAQADAACGYWRE